MGERRNPKEISKYFVLNENTTYQNLWHTITKAVLRGEFTALNAYIRKEKRSHINVLYFHLKKLEKLWIKPK